MTKTLPLLLVVLAAPVLAAAQSAEVFSAGAASSFGALPAFRFIAAPRPALLQGATAVDLASLRNRNLKAGLHAVLGGKDVWVSGLFDRGNCDRAAGRCVDPGAFVSVLIAGEAQPRVFGVMDLLSSPQTMTIGSGQFKVKLMPSLTDELASEIVVINLADNHKDRISLRDLLKAVGAAGAPFRLAGKDYTVFYYDAVKDGKQDAASPTFAVSGTDASGQTKIFNIPAEWVPSGHAGSFQTLDGQTFGLQKDGDTLQIIAKP
jgi:hypothetical protein